MRNRILALEAENASLRAQVEALQQAQSGVDVEALVAGLGLAAAVGEASMPDRAVGSLSARIQSHMVMGPAGPRLRLRPLEIVDAQPDLSFVSVSLDKVPAGAGQPAPRALYLVLQDKQDAYTAPFWAKQSAAAQIVAETTRGLANTDAWTFPFLLQLAANICQLERTLSASFGDTPGFAAYTVAVDALTALTDGLAKKAVPVAGDVYALESRLDATTQLARALAG